MNNKNFCIIAFESTHDAIETKNILEEHIDIEMIRTPSEIPANCGLSIKFNPIDYEEIVRWLFSDANDVMNKKIYCFQFNDGIQNLKLRN